ncbi:MAG: lipid-A-disaccharide synthase N-terminal domain-containing protein [Bacteroidales bacterium]|nr:lipid-A-disaccharide synthase N-terminal domain-containing protein [Bacteroidales bacterium]
MNGIAHWIVYSIGFAAQSFFAGRTAFQWLDSERKHTVTSPSAYWGLSVAGAFLMFIYGVLRDDFSIVLGQLISYSVYLWNLDIKGVWRRIGKLVKVVLLLTPVIAIVLLLRDAGSVFDNMFRNESIPLGLVIFGSAGQVIFTLRFVYQWFYSHRRQESILPAGFWLISLIGSGVILSYGIFRKDPVLILGQSFGFVAYVRNLMIGFKKKGEYEQAVV